MFRETNGPGVIQPGVRAAERPADAEAGNLAAAVFVQGADGFLMGIAVYENDLHALQAVTLGRDELQVVRFGRVLDKRHRLLQLVSGEEETGLRDLYIRGHIAVEEDDLEFGVVGRANPFDHRAAIRVQRKGLF